MLITCLLMKNKIKKKCVYIYIYINNVLDICGQRDSQNIFIINTFHSILNSNKYNLSIRSHLVIHQIFSEQP